MVPCNILIWSNDSSVYSSNIDLFIAEISYILPAAKRLMVNIPVLTNTAMESTALRWPYTGQDCTVRFLISPCLFFVPWNCTSHLTPELEACAYAHLIFMIQGFCGHYKAQKIESFIFRISNICCVQIAWTNNFSKVAKREGHRSKK